MLCKDNTLLKIFQSQLIETECFLWERITIKSTLGMRDSEICRAKLHLFQNVLPLISITLPENPKKYHYKEWGKLMPFSDWCSTLESSSKCINLILEREDRIVLSLDMRLMFHKVLAMISFPTSWFTRSPKYIVV